MSPTNNFAELRRLISSYFELDEIHTICFDLGIDIEQLSGRGSTKDELVRKLIIYAVRRDKLSDLLTICQRERSNVNWQIATSEEANARPENSILLDFGTIIDPTKLLQSLLIFQNTHSAIYVPKHNLSAREWLEEPGGPTPITFSLLDKGYSKHLEKYHGYSLNNLRLSSDNFQLALNILQFAVQEGLIRIEQGIIEQPASEFEIMSDPDLHNLLASLRQNFWFGAGDNENCSWRGGFVISPTFGYGPDLLGPNAIHDVSIYLQKKHHVVLYGDLSPIPSASKLFDLYQVHSSLCRETFKLVKPQRFYDYQKMIEIAGALPKIVGVLESNLQSQLQQTVLQWFVPQLSLTSKNGQYTAQILHSILRQRLQNDQISEESQEQ